MTSLFDPDSPVELDKEPTEMVAAERAEAAKHTLYEIIRALTSQAVAAEYMAELAGVPEDEVQAVTSRAEADEYRDLADPHDEDDDAHDESDEIYSYEEAEAAGYDPEAAADRIFRGGREA